MSDFDRYQAANLDLFCGDFFALTPALVGNVAAVYDRAALISWAPELRAHYVEHLTALTGRGTEKTLLVTLDDDQAEMSGPPFSVDEAEIRRLYPPDHAVRRLARRETLDMEPRLRARGLTRLSESCYHLVQHD